MRLRYIRWVEQPAAVSRKQHAVQPASRCALCNYSLDFVVLRLDDLLGPVQAELDRPMAGLKLLLYLLNARVWHWSLAVPEVRSLSEDGGPLDDIEDVADGWQDAIAPHLAEHFCYDANIFKVRHIERAARVGLRGRRQPDTHLSDDAEVALQEEAFYGWTETEFGEVRRRRA